MNKPKSKPEIAPTAVVRMPSKKKIRWTNLGEAPRWNRSFISFFFSIISIVKAPIILKVAMMRIKLKMINTANFSEFKILYKKACCWYLLSTLY
jgi:hypothetical protein